MGKITKECNSLILTLVPKIQNLLGLEDYIPIFLVKCIYKIISKILGNRLKCVLPYITVSQCLSKGELYWIHPGSK